MDSVLRLLFKQLSYLDHCKDSFSFSPFSFIQLIFIQFGFRQIFRHHVFYKGYLLLLLLPCAVAGSQLVIGC